MSVITLVSRKPDRNMIEMIEDVLHRARAGLVHGIALVEHRNDDEVAFQFFHSPGSYHHMNSGAARLAHALAGAQHEDE